MAPPPVILPRNIVVPIPMSRVQTNVTDNCQKCGQQFVAKTKIVKEKNCDDCRIAKCCEVRNSISNLIVTETKTNTILFTFI